MLNYESAAELLKQHSQLQILDYYGELDESAQQKLLSQIEAVDWRLPLSAHNEKTRGVITPLGALEADEIEKHRAEYERTGIKALHEGKVGAVLLAGGQGTRLGSNNPKGMFDMGITRSYYIFQSHFDYLNEVSEKAGAWIPLYIMTSEKNDSQTRAFLKEKKYFGYNPEYVRFFVQDMNPSVDLNGKILLEQKYSISLSPNGNGGWFSSLERAGLLKSIKGAGIEWLSVFAVDNVLQKINDPCFVGAVISSGCESGAKVVRKASPDERVGVLCLEDGKPSIVEYYEMTDEIRNSRDENGCLLYNFGVILNYMFRVDKLLETIGRELPVHIAKKKIPFVGKDGETVIPEEPNGYKLETLVLDMVHMMNDCLSYEVVREKEFAPVKNATGTDSVESARELLRLNGVEL